MTEQKNIPRIERQMVYTAIGAFILLILIEIIAYYILFKDIPDFLQKYGYYIFLLIIAIVINATAVWHIKAYKRIFPCMTGMMIGMTIGMTTGLSISLIVGAANGMFFGGLSGLILGMLVGAGVGNCCGIMGAMEGMMAGLMGGMMGPMIALMALGYVKILVAVVLFAIILILISLMIMMYKEELALEEKTPYRGYSFIPFSVVCIVILLILTFIIVYAPKTFLFTSS